jgi:Fe-S-cluster containining protein
MGRRLPVWTCAQTGDCCTVPVVMTRHEARLVIEAADKELHWSIVDADKVALVSPTGEARCPLLGADRRCTVYAVRPYRCRVFACLRQPGEPLEPGGPMGCANARRAITDRATRRWYATYERKAQQWALKHGWSPSDGTDG